MPDTLSRALTILLILSHLLIGPPAGAVVLLDLPTDEASLTDGSSGNIAGSQQTPLGESGCDESCSFAESQHNLQSSGAAHDVLDGGDAPRHHLVQLPDNPVAGRLLRPPIG